MGGAMPCGYCALRGQLAAFMTSPITVFDQSPETKKREVTEGEAYEKTPRCEIAIPKSAKPCISMVYNLFFRHYGNNKGNKRRQTRQHKIEFYK
jgi:hypothetical protein